jgi:hypothetical protein
MPFPKRASKGLSSPKSLTATKAKQILSDGTVRGNPLTAKQKGFFGARAGGAPMPSPKNPPGRKLGRMGGGGGALY